MPAEGRNEGNRFFLHIIHPSSEADLLLHPGQRALVHAAGIPISVVQRVRARPVEQRDEVLPGRLLGRFLHDGRPGNAEAGGRTRLLTQDVR